jgi:hypothetical protein
MRLLPMRLLQKAAAGYSKGTRALAISGGYAAIVLGVATFVLVANSLQPASLVAMWLFLVTAPASLLISFIPGEGNLYGLLLTLGGLTQAWLLWIGLRGERLP